MSPEGTTANRGSKLPQNGDTLVGANLLSSTRVSRVAPLDGEVQPLGYALKCQLCWRVENPFIQHSPRRPLFRSPRPCTATCHLLPGAGPSLVLERPCPAQARIRGATVQPSGPRGNCASPKSTPATSATKTRATSGMKTGGVTPPPTCYSIPGKVDTKQSAFSFVMEAVDLFAKTSC